MSTTTDERKGVTISMGTDQLKDGSFVVRVYITGLVSQRLADAALAHMQHLMCGDEINPQ